MYVLSNSFKLSTLFEIRYTKFVLNISRWCFVCFLICVDKHEYIYLILISRLYFMYLRVQSVFLITGFVFYKLSYRKLYFFLYINYLYFASLAYNA